MFDKSNGGHIAAQHMYMACSAIMDVMIMIAVFWRIPVCIAIGMRRLAGCGRVKVEMLRFRHGRDQERTRRKRGGEKPESRKKWR